MAAALSEIFAKITGEAPHTEHVKAVSHWRGDHRICDACPPLRKRLAQIAQIATWVVGTALALFVLWVSPGIYHRVVTYVREYNECVNSASDSSTMGDVLRTRLLCNDTARGSSGRVVRPIR